MGRCCRASAGAFFGLELHGIEAEIEVTATGQGDGGGRGALRRRAPADLGGREREREQRRRRGSRARGDQGGVVASPHADRLEGEASSAKLEVAGVDARASSTQLLRGMGEEDDRGGWWWAGPQVSSR